MKIVVLGAGIAGVTTAYELCQDGHEVTVLDRHMEAASFTSYANAGLVTPAHAHAWSSPAAPGILMKSLWRNDQALRFKLSLDPAFWRWMWGFWRECNHERAIINTTRKVRLCLYSQSCFHDTVHKTGVVYDGRQGGLLYLYRSARGFEAASAKAEILIGNGCAIERLSPDGIAQKDPVLGKAKHLFSGALFASADESGDCRMFTRNLVEWLKDAGVIFKFGAEITRLECEGGKVVCVHTAAGREQADAYVLCLGVYSPHLVRDLDIGLPVYPVKGYSITAPVAGRNSAPSIGGVDEDSLVAYCPLGDRLRITATAEFSGYGLDHKPADFNTMLKTARELFPGGADYDAGERWAGLRPMTPTSVPIVDRGRLENLWFNTGHGHMGWTMSHGTARLTADLIAGKPAAVPLDGMTLDS